MVGVKSKSPEAKRSENSLFVFAEYEILNKVQTPRPYERCNFLIYRDVTNFL